MELIKRLLCLVILVFSYGLCILPGYGVQLGADESLNDHILNHTTGAITGTMVGTTLIIPWNDVPDGLDLNSKRLTYTEGMGDFHWGSNLVLNLSYSGGYYCSITNTGTGYSSTNGVISTSGSGEDARTGNITISNAGDIVVGFIDTRNTHRYPGGSYAGMPCGSVTVLHTGSFYAARVRTGRSGPQSFTGNGNGVFKVTQGLEALGVNCDITIKKYSSVQIDGGVLTGGNGGSDYGVQIGRLFIGESANPISGTVTINGGISTVGTNFSGGWSPGSATIYATGNIQLSGMIDMRVNETRNGTLTMVSINGSIYVEQLDMSKVKNVTFNAGSKTSYITGPLLNFDRSGNRTSGALDAPAGQTVRYRASLPANKYLMEDGYDGIYILKSGGILKPAPMGLVIYFR